MTHSELCGHHVMGPCLCPPGSWLSVKSRVTAWGGPRAAVRPRRAFRRCVRPQCNPFFVVIFSLMTLMLVYVSVDNESQIKLEEHAQLLSAFSLQQVIEAQGSRGNAFDNVLVDTTNRSSRFGWRPAGGPILPGEEEGEGAGENTWLGGERPPRMRMCSQQERLQHVRRVCRKYRGAMSDRLLEPAKRLMADEIHNILYCQMSKVGCTAFKTVISKANANVLQKEYLVPATSTLEMDIHAERYTNALNFFYISHFNASEQTLRVEKYFKFMAMRHPFERLISAWRDKVLHKSEYTSWPSAILENARPDIFDDMNLFQKWYWQLVGSEHRVGLPRFDEFVAWVVDQHVYNEHWLTAIDSCHVCAHDWDAILRIETMDIDSNILLQRLKDDLPNGIDDMKIVHSRQRNPKFFYPSKELDLWKNISSKHEEYFLNLYNIDMEMFGYKWDRRKKRTVCEIETPNGPCC